MYYVLLFYRKKYKVHVFIKKKSICLLSYKININIIRKYHIITSLKNHEIIFIIFIVMLSII